MNIFEERAREYDEWYESHPLFYESELQALRKVIPPKMKGLEIGVGTGRFAQPLQVQYGIEPAEAMGIIAKERGIQVARGCAEELPILPGSMDYILMVTTVCFLKDLIKAFNETHRVLKKQGKIIIGMINKNSELGKTYEQKKDKSLFYTDAHFHEVEEIVQLLIQARFKDFSFYQTLTQSDLKEVEVPQPGFNTGGFVVIQAHRN
jgi:ubiquinone/menaquinone biosynthesis C-methylase UbiE